MVQRNYPKRCTLPQGMNDSCHASEGKMHLRDTVKKSKCQQFESSQIRSDGPCKLTPNLRSNLRTLPTFLPCKRWTLDLLHDPNTSYSPVHEVVNGCLLLMCCIIIDGVIIAGILSIAGTCFVSEQLVDVISRIFERT